MNKQFKAVSLAFLSTVGVVGCENAADKEIKSTLVQDVVNRSLQECNLQTGYSQERNYEDRLLSMLMSVGSKQLNNVKENDIRICLDQRLSDFGRGSRKPVMMFYPYPENTLSVYDDGKNAGKRANRTISKFFNTVDVSNKENTISYGYNYKRYKKSRKYRWKDIENQKIFKLNPNILTSPALPEFQK